MKKLTVNKQEELFAQDCKLINLRYEYSGFTGMEKWAIITELSEEALWDKYCYCCVHYECNKKEVFAVPHYFRRGFWSDEAFNGVA